MPLRKFAHVRPHARQAATIAQRVAEWKRPSDDPRQPIIMTEGGGRQPIHVYVVWDDWEPLDQIERSEVVMEASRNRRRQKNPRCHRRHGPDQNRGPTPRHRLRITWPLAYGIRMTTLTKTFLTAPDAPDLEHRRRQPRRPDRGNARQHGSPASLDPRRPALVLRTDGEMILEAVPTSATSTAVPKKSAKTSPTTSMSPTPTAWTTSPA